MGTSTRTKYRQCFSFLRNGILLKTLVLLICLTSITLDASAQSKKSKKWGRKQTSTFSEIISSNWSGTINAGGASYYGDMSIYDYDYIKKLGHETGYTVGATVMNKVLSFLGIQFRANYSTFKAEYPGNNRRVDGAVTGLFGTLAIDFVGLFNLPNEVNTYIPVYPYGIIGGGISLISSKLYNLESDQRIETHEYQRVGTNEATFNFGLGLNILLYQDIDVVTEFTYNRLHTDKLDVRVSSNPNDYYTLFTVGIKYNIPSSKASNAAFPRLGNKKTRNYRR